MPGNSGYPLQHPSNASGYPVPQYGIAQRPGYAAHGKGPVFLKLAIALNFFVHILIGRLRTNCEKQMAPLEMKEDAVGMDLETVITVMKEGIRGKVKVIKGNMVDMVGTTEGIALKEDTVGTMEGTAMKEDTVGTTKGMAIKDTACIKEGMAGMKEDRAMEVAMVVVMIGTEIFCIKL
jgi:hypothetical protein